MNVWDAPPHLVALHDQVLYKQEIRVDEKRYLALQQLQSGKEIRSIFGWSSSKLSLNQIRELAIVPAKRVVLCKRHWMREPWRLTFARFEDAQKCFDTIKAEYVADAAIMTESKVGPHDLALDPKIILGVLATIIGMLAILGGALDGAQQVQIVPRDQLLRLFGEFGQQIGAVGVSILGILIACIGIAGLFWWYKTRPMKWSVRKI